MKSSLFRFILLFLVAGSTALFASLGVGTMTITNQTTPRICVTDSDGILLDPGLQISFDATVPASYVRSWNSLTSLNLWHGGTIYVTIDAVPNGNAFDTLSCVPSGLITSAYSVANRTLTIAAGALNTTTVTYADIQATLRTLKLQIKGQCVATRTIRIFVETPGFRFVNSRGGRIYAVVAESITGIEDLYWYDAQTDIGKQPYRYGLKQYFASITSAAENVFTNGLLSAELGGANWLGARAVNTAVAGNATVIAAGTTLNATVTGQANGNWVWADGPDYGVVFWSGGGKGAGGAAVGGAYDDFHAATNEPNSSNNTDEIAAEIIDSWGGDWNNNSISNFVRGGWLVEYGGLGAKDRNTIKIQVIGANALLMANPF